MNDLLTFLKDSLVYDIEDLMLAVFLCLVVFSAYYWLNIRLSGIIRSVFLRRTTIVLVAWTVFSVYYLIYLFGRSLEVREFDLRNYLSIVICSFTFFNLYYLFTYKLAKRNQSWVPAIQFFIMFLVFWIFLLSPLWLVNVMKNSKQSYINIIVGNNHLPEAFRISSFVKNVVFYAVIALLATSIDFGCRYILKLQKFQKKEKELETIKMKEQLTKVQLEALHAKVNPHFLYNALNSIAGLALTDGTKTRQMAISLSKFFRYSINQEQNNLVTLKEELAMVETYLEIEKIRFEDRLNFELVIQPGLEQLKIPRFILQPLVENSVKHGLKGTKHELFIQIQAQLNGNLLALSIQDNGLPFATDMEPGYGLKSVYDKLDLLFPDKYEVALFNEPVKQVKILIET